LVSSSAALAAVLFIVVDDFDIQLILETPGDSPANAAGTENHNVFKPALRFAEIF
jgi:hypothetical protein